MFLSWVHLVLPEFNHPIFLFLSWVRLVPGFNHPFFCFFLFEFALWCRDLIAILFLLRFNYCFFCYWELITLSLSIVMPIGIHGECYLSLIFWKVSWIKLKKMFSFIPVRRSRYLAYLKMHGISSPCKIPLYNKTR